jgi:drug/metabolite transporter (DMT)-like permease
VCWGIDNNLTALIDGVTPAQSTAVKGIVAGATNLTLGILLGSHTLPVNATLGALAVGAVGYGLSLVLYINGAQQLGATRSQMVFASAPFWGVLISWIALAESVTTAQLAAGGLMGLALWLMHGAARPSARTRAGDACPSPPPRRSAPRARPPRPTGLDVAQP